MYDYEHVFSGIFYSHIHVTTHQALHIMSVLKFHLDCLIFDTYVRYLTSGYSEPSQLLAKHSTPENEDELSHSSKSPFKL